MSDFYQEDYKAYHEKTFSIDPSSFLQPLVKRIRPGASILDVGCGSGRDILWMKNKGFKVIGFERSPGLAELARNNTGCKVIDGDFETYDFSTFRVDAVILVGAFVHIPHDRFPEIFKRITSTLSNNGYVLITLKEGSGTRTDSDGRTFYLWQDETARTLFNTLDFKVGDFSRSVSKTGSGESWLGYVLEKT